MCTLQMGRRLPAFAATVAIRSAIRLWSLYLVVVITIHSLCIVEIRVVCDVTKRQKVYKHQAIW